MKPLRPGDTWIVDDEACYTLISTRPYAFLTIERGVPDVWVPSFQGDESNIRGLMSTSKLIAGDK
jgi:hypothetical protein